MYIINLCLKELLLCVNIDKKENIDNKKISYVNIQQYIITRWREKQSYFFQELIKVWLQYYSCVVIDFIFGYFALSKTCFKFIFVVGFVREGKTEKER